MAAGRILNVLNADARVTVVSPRARLNDEVAFRVQAKQVALVDRKFEPGDLDGVDMVLTAVDDAAASSQVWRLCKERRIPVNVADVPSECDFYFGSVHRDGPLQIMISTNGNGPKMANLVRKQVAASLPPNVGDAIKKVGALRKKLRKLAPTPEEGPKRMQWYVFPVVDITRVCRLTFAQGCRRSAKTGRSKTSATWTTKIWKVS